MVFYNQSCYLDYRHPPQGLAGVNSESSCWPFTLTLTHLPTSLFKHAPSTIYCHSPTGPLIACHLTVYLPSLHSPIHPHTTPHPSVHPTDPLIHTSSHQPTYPPVHLPILLDTAASICLLYLRHCTRSWGLKDKLMCFCR